MITFPGPSSLSTTIDGFPLPPVTSTGTISHVKAPLSWEAIARSKLWIAWLSWGKDKAINKESLIMILLKLSEQWLILKYHVVFCYWMVLSTQFGTRSHVDIVIDIPQTIFQHPINKWIMSKAGSFPELAVLDWFISTNKKILRNCQIKGNSDTLLLQST